MKKIIILFLLSVLTQHGKAQSLTWADDIAEIVYNKCASCHHTGGLAPFNLMSYSETMQSAVAIDNAVTNKIMPPWKADPNYLHFKGEFNLTNYEITKIHDWILAGTPEGNAANAPAPPVFTIGSQLNQLDQTIQLPTFSVDSIGDQYRSFAIHSNYTSDTYINQIEYIPGNGAIVHHIVIYYDPSNYSWNLDQSDPAPGFSSNGTMQESPYAQFMGAWAPGAGIYSFPNNFGIKIPAGSDFVVEVHYAPGSIGEIDSSKINFTFLTPNANTREVYFNALLEYFTGMINGPLFIPANQVKTFYEAFSVSDVGAPISLISVWPHMHRVGSSFKSYALNPQGDTTRLLNVPKWDFHWQLVYNYRNLIPMQLNQTMYAEASYDNTISNLDNPNSPPQNVFAGEHTTDEMMLGFFAFTLYQPGDENFIIDSTYISSDKTINNPNVSFSIYPNPVKDILIIKGISKESTSSNNIIIYDLTGRKVLETSMKKNSLDVSMLNSGMYIIEIENERLKFVKQ